MQPPVIRIRADLNDYVMEEAGRRQVTPSDFVNGVVEAHRFLDARHRIGFEPALDAALRDNQGKWIAFVLAVPGQPLLLAAGSIEKVEPTVVTLSIPSGPATTFYDVSRGWVESFYFLDPQVRSDLRSIVARLQPWGVAPHYLTRAFLVT